MQIQFQKELDKLLGTLTQTGRVPSLLLHACCAPCSSYVLEYLSQYFYITLFYYNPNIAPQEEYTRRVEEVKHLLNQLPQKYPVTLIEGRYEPERFYAAVKGHEQDSEGGERCFACYRLRLEEAAQAAKKLGCDYFTTTLSISPLKNAQKLNEIGAELSKSYGVAYLFSDFKKREGYKRSIVLSKEYGLYRQNFCGCVFSRPKNPPETEPSSETSLR